MASKKIRLDVIPRMFINHQGQLVYTTAPQMLQNFKSRVYPLFYLLLRRAVGFPKDIAVHFLQYLHWDYLECPIWNYFQESPNDAVCFVVKPHIWADAFETVYSDEMTYDTWCFKGGKNNRGFICHKTLTKIQGGHCDVFFVIIPDDELDYFSTTGFTNFIRIDLRDHPCAAATAASGGGGDSGDD